jgi:dTDP-4-amino-4,6-dideoxygalactose transaminase
MFENNIEPALNSLPVCTQLNCFKKYIKKDYKQSDKIHNNYVLLPLHSDFNKYEFKKIKNFILINYNKNFK